LMSIGIGRERPLIGGGVAVSLLATWGKPSRIARPAERLTGTGGLAAAANLRHGKRKPSGDVNLSISI